jgi:hypothetical protein
MGEAEPHPRATRSQRRRKKKNQHSLQEPENDNQPKKSNQPARRPQTRMNEPRKGGQEPYIQSKDLVVTAPPPLRSRHAAPATGRRPSRVHRQRPPAVGTRTRPEARRKRERERDGDGEVRYAAGGGRSRLLFVDALLMVALRPNNYYSPCREERRGEERKRKESKQPGKRKLPPFARRLKPLTSAHPPIHHCPLLLATRAPSLALLWIRPVVMRCIC